MASSYHSIQTFGQCTEVQSREIRYAHQGRGTPLFKMFNPISSAQASYASQATQPVQRKPQPQKPASAEVQDKLTLSSANMDVDHDGDSK
jgi:hypothetical protein